VPDPAQQDVFVADVAKHAGEALRVYNDLRGALRELDVRTQEVGNRELTTDFTPSPSYEPITVRFLFPEAHGLVAAEGLLFALPPGEEPTEDLRIGLNYLNQELGTFSFYVAPVEGGSEVVVRQDLLPNLNQRSSLHPREIKHAMTGLCAQKAIFAGPLQRVQEGHSWRFVKEALKAIR